MIYVTAIFVVELLLLPKEWTWHRELWLSRSGGVHGNFNSLIIFCSLSRCSPSSKYVLFSFLKIMMLSLKRYWNDFTVACQIGAGNGSGQPLGKGIFQHWHCLELSAHGNNQKQTSL